MAGTLSARTPARRRVAQALLLLAVLAAHGWLGGELADQVAAFDPVRAMPPRIEVAYVRELELAPPTVYAAPAPVSPPAVRPPKRSAPPASAASAASAADKPLAVVVAEAAPPPAVEVPAEDATPPVTAPEPAASATPSPLPVAEPAASEAAAAAASAPANAASAPPAFVWPGSTRLSYVLTGNVRGEVNGDAQVEWVRVGQRYQVHLDITVGLPVAPLITRRMSSDGELTEHGLRPQRYDEDTKVMFRERRRLTMLFEPEWIVLPNGQRRERWPGVQDTASQFVQLSWLFTTRPELLRRGGTIELPLALPRSVDRWVYDVIDEESVATSFGAVPAFHLKPRRVSRRGSELVAEIWFAPQLRYLPARIRIEQDAETYIDLVLARRPELAAP
jgi:hypothetical protein